MPKISELTPASAPADGDLVPIVQGGQTRRATVSQVRGMPAPPSEGTWAWVVTDGVGAWEPAVVLPDDAPGDGQGLVWSAALGRLVWSDLSGGGGAPTTYREAVATEGWWPAPYSGSPWEDASGNSRPLTEATTPPDVGAALNGKTGARFNSAQVISTGLPLSTFIDATGYSFWFVARAVTVPADPASASDYNTIAGLFGDSGGTYLSLAAHDGGYTLSQYDGAYKVITAPCDPTTAVVIVHGKYDGTNLHLGVDGTWATPVAAGSVGSLTGTLAVGRGSTNVRFDGTFWEGAFTKGVISDADFADIIAELQAEYAL
jgi:hypothetical protein